MPNKKLQKLPIHRDKKGNRNNVYSASHKKVESQYTSRVF